MYKLNSFHYTLYLGIGTQGLGFKHGVIELLIKILNLRLKRVALCIYFTLILMGYWVATLTLDTYNLTLGIVYDIPHMHLLDSQISTKSLGNYSHCSFCVFSLKINHTLLGK